MFKELFEEVTDKTDKKLVQLALKWLKKKFPVDKYGYTFKYVPGVINTTKVYSVSVDGEEFDIEGRIFDANGDGKESPGDVVQFKISPTQEIEEEPEIEPGF